MTKLPPYKLNRKRGNVKNIYRSKLFLRPSLFFLLTDDKFRHSIFINTRNYKIPASFLQSVHSILKHPKIQFLSKIQSNKNLEIKTPKFKINIHKSKYSNSNQNTQIDQNILLSPPMFHCLHMPQMSLAQSI